MSTQVETTEAIEIPADLGRNDPCPCGSGKKYKKCHMRINQALGEATKKKTRSIEQLIGANTIAYDAYKVLADIHANNLLSLFFDATHEEGPWRAEHPQREAFLLGASEGKITLPAGEDFEFMRMRVDEPDVHILLARHAEDPRYDHVSYQVLTLRRNEFDAEGKPREAEAGWRLFEMKTQEVAKSALGEEGADLHLDHFGIGWHERGLRDAPTHVRPVEEEVAGEEE